MLLPFLCCLKHGTGQMVQPSEYPRAVNLGVPAEEHSDVQTFSSESGFSLWIKCYS